MIKVVVVEDEWILRKGLIRSIEWSAYGCVIVGEAGNGQEGLELILKESPDIVITDICMPIMDGLEMLDEASKSRHFHSIILTSYSEFDYAKKAISLHVTEYLLKPIKESRLCELLKNMVATIQQEQLYGNLKKHVDMGRLTEEELPDLHLAYGEQQNYYAKEAMRQIRENYAQKLSVEQIADSLGVSASYLSRKFKEETQHTFLDYLNQYRITKAVQLLNTGKYRFGEIADMTGFTNHKHFYGVFRKYVHMTPSEFAKEKMLIIEKDPGEAEA